MDYTRFEIGISEKRTAWLVAFVDKQEADFFSSGFGRLSSVARSLHHAKQEYKYRGKVKASVIAVREIQVATRTTDKASVGTKCTSPGQIFFFRSAADIAQRLGPESWILFKKANNGPREPSPVCTTQSLRCQLTQKHKTTPSQTKCKSPSQICVSSHANKTKQKPTAARGQGPKQKHHQLPQKALMGHSTP